MAIATGVIIGIGVVAAVIIHGIMSDHLPSKYKFRLCQGVYWRRKYPNAPKEKIRDFLKLFNNTYGFNDKGRCRFRPDDKIFDIHYSIYSRISRCDGGELEDFAIALEHRHDLNLENAFHDHATLGEIFERTL